MTNESAPAAGPADGDELRAVARLLAPGSSDTSPPPVPPGTVRRQTALDRVAERSDAPCVLINAPAGYGKTTILATLAAQDPRPCAWVTLGRADDDPSALLAHVLIALDGVAPVPDDAFEHLLLSEADLETVRLPRLASVLAAQPCPFLLVLDDAHRLATPRALEVVRVLVEHVPPGSRVALATRDASGLGLARSRAAGSLLDLGLRDLSMSIDEGTRLLRQAGLDLGDEAAEALVEQTEGWPAALYLCALALRDAPPAAVAAFGGRERVVADYLVAEVLATVSATQLEFMLATSILDRLSGSVCDAVLERTDSAGALEKLAGENRFVVALDGAGDWYRYHNLFQDLLRAELERRDGGAVGRLHGRASEWFEAWGDVDEAIRHAQAARETRRVIELIWRHAPFFLATGRSATVLGLWLTPFSAAEIAAEPALAVITAWCCFTDGDVDQIEAWLTFAEGATERTLPDGSPVQSSVAVLRALGGRRGVSEMRADAAKAVELLPADNPFVALAWLFEGAAARLLGQAERARSCFERAVSIGDLLLPASGIHAQALLALLAIDRDEWAEASSRVVRALARVDELHLHERPGMSLVFSTAALVAAHEGSTTAARELSKRSNWLLAALKGLSPWITAEIRINLARVELFLGDVSAAQRSLTQAERILAGYPDAGSLAARLEAVRRQVNVTNRPLGLAAAPLTAAELRVLRYLPTHLSFAQIADELFVSRNTVKTQAIAVYRKLDVSSRAEAVARARDFGLVDASRGPSTSST